MFYVLFKCQRNTQSNKFAIIYFYVFKTDSNNKIKYNGHYQTKDSQRKLSGRQILLVSQITLVDMCQKIAISLSPEKRYDTFLDF